jgi:hypothetical protein
MEKPQGAAISPSLRTLTRVPYASGNTAAPLLFLVQSEKCTTDSRGGLNIRRFFCLETEIFDQSPQISPVSANFNVERHD